MLVDTDGVAVSESATGAPPWLRGLPSLSEGLARYGVVIVFLLITGVFCIWLPNHFATAANFRAMVNSQSILLALAGVATLALRTGDFDLSIASVMVFSASTVAELSANDHWSPLAAIAMALVIGLVVGTINAFLVVKVRIEAFIVTLGMLTALEGLSYWVTNSAVVGNIPQTIMSISRANVLGFQASAWFAWGLIAVLWYLYERTPLGRYLLFIGGSREAARLAGLRVERIRMATFIASATLSALIGVLLVGQLGAMDPSTAGQYLLQPFAAAYLGATTIKVGRFNAIGTLVAMYLLVVGITGLQLLGAQQWVTDVFNGGALVVAVTVSQLASRRVR